MTIFETSIPQLKSTLRAFTHSPFKPSRALGFSLQTLYILTDDASSMTLSQSSSWNELRANKPICDIRWYSVLSSACSIVTPPPNTLKRTPHHAHRRWYSISRVRSIASETQEHYLTRDRTRPTPSTRSPVPCIQGEVLVPWRLPVETFFPLAASVGHHLMSRLWPSRPPSQISRCSN